MSLTHEQRQQAAFHRRALKALGKEAKANAPAKVKQARTFPTAAGQRDPRQKDADFVSWLHGLFCIACKIEGPPADPGPIEAAHQKLAIASKGWREGGLGPRVHDGRCVPLCRAHHRLAPNSCDLGGQRKFWDRLGIGDQIADLCAALLATFRSGGDGNAVIRRFIAERVSHPLLIDRTDP